MFDERDKELIRITKILYPTQFNDDNSTYERGRLFKYKSLQRIMVVHEIKAKHQYAKFFIRLLYEDKLKNHRAPKLKEWITCHEINPYIDLPVLTIVKRDIIKKSVTDVVHGMINVFNANVLLCKDFKYVDFERPPLKNMFKINGINLVYQDEL